MLELGMSVLFNGGSMERILSPRCFSLQELLLSSYGQTVNVNARFLWSGNNFPQRINQPFTHAPTLWLEKENKLGSPLGCLGICLSSSTEPVSKGTQTYPSWATPSTRATQRCTYTVMVWFAKCQL